MFRSLKLVVLFLIATTANAQNNGKLKVFIDCRTGCDFTFFKSEISVVDFVLDRSLADAHVLLTSQRVGGGGQRYQMNIYGQNLFKKYQDTLIFTTLPNATNTDVRRSMLQYLMLGFAPMIAKTPYAANVKLSMKDTLLMSPPLETDQHDKWNFWVFRVSASGQLNADRVYNNNVVSSDISANRTTDKLKVEFYLDGDLRKSVYTYENATDTTQYTVNNSNYRLYHNLVKSFSDHWSYGYQTSFS